MLRNVGTCNVYTSVYTRRVVVLKTAKIKTKFISEIAERIIKTRQLSTESQID